MKQYLNMGLLEGFIAWAQEFAGAWGYLGIFLINFLGSATIFFPVPAFIVVFLFGGILNPWLVGISAGIGAALGELTGYAIGKGGEVALKKKYKKWILRGEKWFRNHMAFPFIVIFAATPLPDDVLGILCGTEHDLCPFGSALGDPTGDQANGHRAGIHQQPPNKRNNAAQRRLLAAL